MNMPTTTALESRIHMIFGHHTASEIPKIKQLITQAPQTGRRSIFIAELGGIHFAEFEILMQGTPALANAILCLQTGEINTQFQQDIDAYIQSLATTVLRNRILQMENSKTTKGKKKQRTRPKRYNRDQLIKIAQKNFQLALLLMARQKGYAVATEFPSPEAIFYLWQQTGAEQRINLYWANAEPSKFDFQAMLELTKISYGLLALHAMRRNKDLQKMLYSVAMDCERVLVQMGIAHKGFFEREMPGIHIHTHSEPILIEKILSDEINPGNLTDFHMAQILKDMIYRVISNYSSLSLFQAAELVNKLPDDLTSLERFYVISNGMFHSSLKRKESDPQQIVKEVVDTIIRSLG